jgi:hypothetical protein
MGVIVFGLWTFCKTPLRLVSDNMDVVGRTGEQSVRV